MKLTWITNKKTMRSTMTITRNYQLRFKQHFAKEFDLKKDDRWSIGYDEEEVDRRHFYMLQDGTEMLDGYKMGYNNKSFFIMCKTLCDQMGIVPPLICEIEPFEFENYKGFKIKLPNTHITNNQK